MLLQQPALPAPGAKSSGAHPVEADLSFAVAGGEVGFGLRGRALGASPAAHALVSALGLLPALLVATLVAALMSATRTLTRADGT